MDTNIEARKFIFTFPKTKKPTFFERARKHIIKGSKGNHNLSKKIDNILYGKK